MSETYELSVRDRLLLQSILPAEGSFTTVRLVHKLREALSFSEEEHARLKFKQQDDLTMWETTAEEPKAVTIGPKMLSLIAERLNELDKQSKLKAEHLRLYDLFMTEEDEPEG